MGKKLFNTLWPDLFVIATLLASGWKYISGIENLLDIRLYDESNYLWGGVTLFNHISVAGTVAENTQIYSFWYYILSLFAPDRISLYYLNYKVLTILLTILLYLVLRRYHVNILTSIIICFFFLISDSNLGVWPKVGHFALAIILASFILASFTKSPTRSLAIVCLGAVLSTYARPEIFVTFILFSFLLIRSVFIEFKSQSSRDYAVLLGVVLLTGFLIMQFGIPITGARSFGAFGQHFSSNWVQWTNNQVLSNWTDWEIIISQNFGEVHSITEAFVANPQIFMKHVLSNLIRVPGSLLELFFIHANLILSPAYKNLEAIMLSGLLIFFALFLKVKWNIPKKLHVATNKKILLYSSCYLAVSMISILIIFPRDHYLILPGVMTIIMISTLLAKENITHEPIVYKIIIPLSLGLFLITPSFTSLMGNFGEKTNVETILFIQSLNIKEEVYLLEANGGFHIYLGNNFHRVASYDKESDFNDFMQTRNINAIIVSTALMNDSRFKEDKDWEFFLNNHHILDFVKIDIPGVERQLIIEEELIDVPYLSDQN